MRSHARREAKRSSDDACSFRACCVVSPLRLRSTTESICSNSTLLKRCRITASSLAVSCVARKAASRAIRMSLAAPAVSAMRHSSRSPDASASRRFPCWLSRTAAAIAAAQSASSTALSAMRSSTDRIRSIVAYNVASRTALLFTAIRSPTRTGVSRCRAASLVPRAAAPEIA